MVSLMTEPAVALVVSWLKQRLLNILIIIFGKKYSFSVHSDKMCLALPKILTKIWQLNIQFGSHGCTHKRDCIIYFVDQKVLPTRQDQRGIKARSNLREGCFPLIIVYQLKNLPVLTKLCPALTFKSKMLAPLQIW